MAARVIESRDDPAPKGLHGKGGLVAVSPGQGRGHALEPLEELRGKASEARHGVPDEPRLEGELEWVVRMLELAAPALAEGGTSRGGAPR